MYGIKDEALKKFNTYLTNRKQQVSVSYTKSDLSKCHMTWHKVIYKGHCYFYYLLMIYHYTQTTCQLISMQMTQLCMIFKIQCNRLKVIFKPLSITYTSGVKTMG